MLPFGKRARDKPGAGISACPGRRPWLGLCMLSACTLLAVLAWRSVVGQLSDPVSYLRAQYAAHGGQNLLEDLARTGLTEAIERVHLVQVPNTGGAVSKLIVDVSLKREWSRVLLPRILGPAGAGAGAFSKFVVDIGAYDGLMASNSYNLIQMGWDALLVEAVPELMKLTKRHVQRIANAPGQSIRYDQVAVAKTPGKVTLALARGETHKAQFEMELESGQNGITADGITVQTLLERNAVPKNFGVLSHDVLHMNDEVVRQVLGLGYTPQFMICAKLTQATRAWVRENHPYVQIEGDWKFNTVWARE